MGLVNLVKTLGSVPILLKLKKAMVPRPSDEKDCIAKRVEQHAQNLSNQTAIIFEGTNTTWHQLNSAANRHARALRDSGISSGDTVSVIMENRVEFLAVVIAINKLGAIGGLINTNLRGKPLAHCIGVTESKICIFGEEVTAALEAVKTELSLEEGRDYFYVADKGKTPAPNWAINLNEASKSLPVDNLEETEQVELGSTALFIFTSGTTGLPKAAVLSNRRYLASAGLSGQAGLRCTPNDRIYICLPLYHGTGLMIGVGAALTTGASMFIRRRFSASNFLKEVREHNATCFIYIGEICRYLLNSEQQADDAKSTLTKMMGNGLRPDIWMEFKNRYGIKRITEFYGASEGNVAFANLMNKDKTVGMTAAHVALVQYDVDADEIVKTSKGHCIAVESGEPGLLLAEIKADAVFEGYTNKEATEKKILRDVFEKGDRWFNSGDLMKTIDVGYSLGYDHYQFVDRIGDTYRWKSENVSTNEVGEIINGFSQVHVANVYGVEIPKADGRAGMAALVLEDDQDLDIDAFSNYVNEELPSYARPVFLRIQRGLDVTGTFKMVKGALRNEAYHLDKVTDTIFVLKPGSERYQLLENEFHSTIMNGDGGY